MHLKTSLATVATVTVAAGVAVGIGLILTNPVKLGPVGVTLWFIALFLTIAGLLASSLYIVKRWLRPHQISDQHLTASLRQGMLISGWVTVMLALSSLGQLNVRDEILTAILIGLIEFYFRARRA